MKTKKKSTTKKPVKPARQSPVAGSRRSGTASKRKLVSSVAKAGTRKNGDAGAEAAAGNFASFFETVSGVLFIIVVEPRGCFRFSAVNHTFLEVTGLKESQIVGKRVQEVIPAPSCDLVLKKYREAIRTGKTVRWEETSVYPTGKRHGEVAVTPVFDSKGKATHLFGIVHDITARKNAEDALRKSESRFRITLESSPIVIMHQDKNLKYTWMWNPNPAFDAAEVIGKTTSDLLQPEEAARLARVKRRVLRTGKPAREQVRLCRAGKQYYYDSIFEPLRDERGDICGISGVAIDITERKKAENALRESEERFRLAIEHSPIHVWQQDEDLKFTWVANPTPELGANDLVGKTDADILCAEEAACLIKLKRAVMKTGAAAREEIRSTLRGQVFFFDTYIEPLRDEHGKICGVACVAVDITARKKAEQVLRESEERYRFLADHTDDIVTLADTKINNLYISPSYFRQTGWTQEELEKTDWLSRVHPEDRPLAKRTRAQNMAGRQTTIEIRIARRDGTWMWVESTCKPIPGPDGKPEKLLIWGHDITARRKAEQSLRESEERFRAVFEQAAVGVAVIETATGRFLSVNQWACDIARRSREQMLSTSYRPLCHPDDNKIDDENMAKLKAGKIRDFSMEKRYVHEDGSITWINLTVSPMWKSGDTPLRHIAIVEDITERKQMENALRESEARYERAVRATNEGLWEWNMVTGKTYLSPRWKALLGFAEDELPDDREIAFYARLHPDDLPVVEAARREHLAKFVPYSVEVRLRMKNGDYRWFQASGQAEGDALGRPVRISGTMCDITERKETEQALRQSEERFRAVFEQAAVGVGTLDFATNRFLEVNQQFCNITGRTKEEMLAGTFIEMTHPDDLRANLQMYESLKAGEITRYTLEKRYIRPDGSIVWCSVHSTRIATKSGAPDRLLAVVEDITERKLAEAKYRRELDFNRTLINHTSALILLLDHEGRVAYVNEATTRLLGYRREELLNRTPLETGVVDAEEAVRSQERVSRLLDGQENPPRQMLLKAKDGSFHPVEVSSTTTRTPDGKPDRMIVTGTDLTERYHLQREILKISEQEQARIGHNLHDGVGQTMTGVAAMMEMLESDLSGEQKIRAGRIRQFIQDAIHEVRQMSHSLSPTAVKNRGLTGALQLLADTIRTNHRTACKLEVDPAIRIEDPEKQTHVYRIAQEAVSNALRHGGAKNIHLSLQHHGDHECVLKVEDDGVGIKKRNGEDSQGIGTRVMEYRANCIGGTLEIMSPRRGGVTVICRFPCGSAATKPGGSGSACDSKKNDTTDWHEGGSAI